MRFVSVLVLPHQRHHGPCAMDADKPFRQRTPFLVRPTTSHIPLTDLDKKVPQCPIRTGHKEHDFAFRDQLSSCPVLSSPKVSYPVLGLVCL